MRERAAFEKELTDLQLEMEQWWASTPENRGTLVADSTEYNLAGKMVRVNSQDYAISRLKIRNWSDPEVGQFTGNRVKGKRKPTAVTGFIIHETRGFEIKWSERVKQSLENRVDKKTGVKQNLGVHGYIDYNGTIIQHNDLVDQLQHSAKFSAKTIGFEIINPVVQNGKALPKGRYDKINTTWDHIGKDHYLIPSKDQLEAVALFILWLTDQSPLAIPREWPGITTISNRRAMLVNTKKEKDCLTVARGIVAHGQLQTNKSDGIFLLLYGWLRIEAGLDIEGAYLEAKRLLGAANLKAGEKTIDLSAYCRF